MRLKMADNIQVLLDWLKIKTRVSPEDVVVALHGAKVNHLLEQEYIRRFSADSYFKPFSAPVVEDEYLRYYLHDFQLDMPRLSFANEDLDDSLAYLNMVIIDGTKVTLESITDGYKVAALDAITPLHGPVLSLTLQLDEVDGVIREDGKLLLDLSKSSDFSVDIDEDENLRIITGALFKALFESLPDDHRIFPLGVIKPGEAPAHMRPHAFALRTQRDTDSDGSLLIFISMKEDFKGTPPSTSHDFKYLHPIDRPNSTATLVLGIRRTMLLALYPKWLESFKQTPVVEYDSERLGRIKLKNIEAQEPRTTKLIENSLKFHLRLAINNDSSRRQADAFNFTLELHENKGSLTWDEIEIEVVIDKLAAMRGGEPVSPKSRKTEVLKMSYTTDYTVDDGPPVKVVRQLGTLSHVDLDRWEESLYEYFYRLHYQDDENTAKQSAARSVVLCLEQVDIFASRAVSKLDEMVAIDQKADALLDRLLALGFDELIVGSDTYGPCDVARFAQIAVHKDAPTLTPQWLIVGSDQSRRMQATGPSPIKRWSVEALNGGNALGTIDELSGLYQAPAADKFPGNLWRERIKATTESGAYSYALATVTKTNLLISPLVKICVPGRKEQLVASSTLEDPAVLQWSLEGEAKGELDATTGRDVGYTPPAAERGKSYVLDEVVVTDPGAPDTDTFRIYLITPMIAGPAEIDVSDVVAGSSARLRPKVTIHPEDDEVTWTVLVGPEGIEPVPGSQHGEAIYTPVSGAAHRFALIEFKAFSPFRTARGLVILPLPLREYKLPAGNQQPSVSILDRKG
jgi:hypothetical protein